jgi:predicted DNA-binding transcriptional regulator AlpA
MKTESGAAVLTAPVSDKLMDDDETGAFIGAKPSTLAVWRCKGIGPEYIKVGRLVRYRLSAVLAWLESRTVRG